MPQIKMSYFLFMSLELTQSLKIMDIMHNMQLLMMKLLPGSNTPPQNKADCIEKKKSVIEIIVQPRTVCDILDQICKDMDLQPTSNSTSSNKMVESHSMLSTPWLGHNYVIVTESEAKAGFQTLTCNFEVKAWNWKKHVSHHAKYHLHKDKGVQVLRIRSGTKVHHLSNGTRCDKMSLLPQSRHNQTNARWILIQLLHTSCNIQKSRNQQKVLKLCPLCRAYWPDDRKPGRNTH